MLYAYACRYLFLFVLDVGTYYKTVPAGILQVDFDAFVDCTMYSRTWLAKHATLSEMPEGGVVITKKMYERFEKK